MKEDITESHEGKWWHVPDDRIEELVKKMSEERSPKVNPVKRETKRSDRSTLADALEQMLARRRALEPMHSPRSLHQETEESRWWHVSDQALDDRICQIRDEHKRSDAKVGAGYAPQSCHTEADQKRQIHVRLNWLSRAAPIPCKRTGRRHPAAPKDDDLISVYFYVVDTGHRFYLNLTPDLKIGPDRKPLENCFTEKFGLGASTKGFIDRAHSFDYKYRRWSSNARPDWVPAWNDCLKSRIEMATGLDIAKQRLFLHGSMVGDDSSTVRSCGITPGAQLRVFTKKEPSSGDQHNLILASTAKAQELVESRRLLEETKRRSEALTRNAQSSCKKKEGLPKHIGMPPMIFQVSPNLIGGAKLEGETIKRVQPFEEFSIYHPAHDRKLERIRSLPAYVTPAQKL